MRARPGFDLLRAALAVGTPWPLKDVLRRLLDDARHLADDHDCDHLGWELREHAREAGRVQLAALDLAYVPEDARRAGGGGGRLLVHARMVGGR